MSDGLWIVLLAAAVVGVCWLVFDWLEGRTQ